MNKSSLKFPKIILIISPLLFLVFYFNPTKFNFVAVVMSFTSHRIDIVEIESLNEVTKIEITLPKDVRAWPIYAEKIHPNLWGLETQVEVCFTALSKDPIKCYLRDDKNNQKKIVLSQNEKIVVFEGHIGDFLYESIQDNKRRTNKTEPFTFWEPMIKLRNSDSKVEGILELNLEEEVLFDPPIKLFSYLPMDTL